MYEHCISCAINVSYVVFSVEWIIIIITTIIKIITITFIIRIKIIFSFSRFMFNSDISTISFISISRIPIVFLIVVILFFIIVIVKITVIFDIIRILIRNI